MTEPSRDTAGRRRRYLRAYERNLREEYGPDASVVLHEFADGWTIRRVERLEDQIVEGHLMKICSREFVRRDRNFFSLRDCDNLPRAAFSAWQVEASSDPYFVNFPTTVSAFGIVATFVVADQAFFVADGRAGSELKPEYVERLREFGRTPSASLPPFPADGRGRMLAVGHAIVPPADAKRRGV